MSKTFYHNLTSKEYNITDVSDVIENMTKTDIIMFSRSGCALLYDIKERDRIEKDEFNFVREVFAEAYKEYYEEEL